MPLSKIGLTDEEIQKINKPYYGEQDTIELPDKEIAKAQLKKVVEFLKPKIYCVPEKIPDGIVFVAVSIDAINALLDEVKEA